MSKSSKIKLIFLLKYIYHKNDDFKDNLLALLLQEDSKIWQRASIAEEIIIFFGGLKSALDPK